MGGGGVQRISKFLKYWNYEDYDISVLTVKSSYFYADDTSLEQDIPPHVNVHRTETFDPFRLMYFFKSFVERSPKNQNKLSKESGNILRKLSGFLFIPDSRILWLPFALYRAGKIHKKHKIDFIITTLPPFTSGIIAWILRKILRIPYILDFRDSWTCNPYIPRISYFHNFLHTKLENFVISRALATIFVNPNLRKYYTTKYKYLNRKQTCVIRNGYDPVDFDFDNHVSDKISKHFFRIGILGTVYSQGNSPKPLLMAVSELMGIIPQLKNKLRIAFIGKWSDDFLKEANSYRLDKVLDWINYLPHKEALAVANQLDALALAIDSSFEGSEHVTPGRIYEYLYLKKPILAICPQNSDIAWLIRECNAGMIIEYEDIETLKKVLTTWITDSDSLKTSFKFDKIERFHRQRLTNQMLEFLKGLSLNYPEK